jgi:hypothetical protein
MCGLRTTDVMPRLASTLLAQTEHMEAVFAHVAWWSRHGDIGSNFERNVRGLPNASDAERVAGLRERGYDGLIYLHDGKLIGHFFFQRHGAELHAFSAWADQERRGEKLIATAALDFVAHASQCGDVTRARIGSGHRLTERLVRPLHQAAGRLGWQIHSGGWIDFSAAEPPASAARPIRV